MFMTNFSYIVFLFLFKFGNTKLVDRGQGCVQISSPDYQILGATFDILCDTSYSHLQYFEVEYAANFSQCIKFCSVFDGPAHCEGVQFEYDTVGYEDGHLCYLLWNTTAAGNGSAKNRVDVAKLRPNRSVYGLLHRYTNIIFTEWQLYGTRRELYVQDRQLYFYCCM